jgi:hypothetical protein
MKKNRQIRRITSIVLFAFAVLLNLIAMAQTTKRQVVNQTAEWFSFNSNIKLHKHYGLTADMQNRFVQDFSAMQHQVRAGFEIYVTPKLSVIPLGYSYIWNYQYGKQPASFVNNERRLYQAIAYKHHLGRVVVSHRIRLEERYIQSHHKEADGTVIDDGYSNKQTRYRYRLMANIPINHAKMEPKTFFISVWDEIFMSRGKLITYNDPDQNRIFAGPGYQFNKKLSVTASYFCQMLIKSNGAKQENNSGFQLQINYNIDLTGQ